MQWSLPIMLLLALAAAAAGKEWSNCPSTGSLKIDIENDDAVTNSYNIEGYDVFFYLHPLLFFHFPWCKRDVWSCCADMDAVVSSIVLQALVSWTRSYWSQLWSASMEGNKNITLYRSPAVVGRVQCFFNSKLRKLNFLFHLFYIFVVVFSLVCFQTLDVCVQSVRHSKRPHDPMEG